MVLARWGLTLKKCIINSFGTCVIHTEHVSCRTPILGCLFIKRPTGNVLTIFLLILVAQNWRNFDVPNSLRFIRPKPACTLVTGVVWVSISAWAEEDEHERYYGLDKTDP